MPDAITGGDPAVVADLRGRMMLGRRAEVIPVECVVRGYLSGLRLEGVPARRARCAASPLPGGLRESDRLPEPIFTPAYEGRRGPARREHRRSRRVVELVGEARAEQVRGMSLALYRHGAAACERAGIILADTKFEFGVARRPAS